MRTGICSIQQALTAEAASIVKQALGLARRRGHAQVTPLHVASAMLGSSNSLLKRACLQCHSHPLQCKALELCFNVSLNRLPASTSSPLLAPSHHSSHPSLSNALVAAFKRAQAHQRRGSIENQQQPILALKIEAEQLIVSILDDPSVSRVMREAGFSSTQVKNKVEQAVSLETSLTPKETPKPLLVGPNSIPFVLNKPLLDHQSAAAAASNDDVMSVVGSLVSNKRNTVIVGESVEGVVRGVMDEFERGKVQGEMRFITLPLFSLRTLSKEEVDHKLVELRCLVKSYVGRGVVLYLGDLQWLSDFWSTYANQRRSYYCAVDHIVMELRRMACGGELGTRLLLLGTASFNTYMTCKTGHPSLEAILDLHPLTLPVATTLTLTLNLNSASQSNWGGAEKHLNCCTDCSVNFDREAQSLTIGMHNKLTSTTSNLPCWLQKYKEERRGSSINEQECVSVMDLCKKWNSICSSSHKHQTLHSPSSSPSVSSHEHDLKFHTTHLNWPSLVEPKRSPKEHQFWISEDNVGDQVCESHLNMFLPDDVHEPKPELLSNPNSSPNSASSSEVMEDLDGDEDDEHDKFKEFSAENLRGLCSALESKVPHQKDMIREIVSTILQCRSGMSKIMNTKLKQRSEDKEETWLVFLGGSEESQDKERIAREIARVVFGSSQSNFVSISPQISLSLSTSSNQEQSKRKRDEENEKGWCNCSYMERFADAVNENPRRVFLMEDLDKIDCQSCQKGIKKGIESGSIALGDGETHVPLKDAIVIFSCESYPVIKACSPPRKLQKCGDHQQKQQDDHNEVEIALDLNIAIHQDEEDSVGDNIGILESVDKVVTFKVQEL